MRIKDNHLYLNLYFIAVVGGDLLPCVDYYTVRNDEVYHIDPETYTETPSGDKLDGLLLCHDLGKYTRDKLNPAYRQLRYISPVRLAEILAREAVKEG